jgi:hypothetical protein
MVQVKQGKLNFTTLADVLEGAVLMGTFSIRDHPIRILFDSGATHSFISESLVSKLGLHSCHTKDSFVVATARGRILSNTITKVVPLQLGSKTLLTNLIHLGLGGLYVILGMNWLTQHQVVLDIATRMVEIHSPTSGHTILYLPQVENTHPSRALISRSSPSLACMRACPSRRRPPLLPLGELRAPLVFLAHQ